MKMSDDTREKSVMSEEERALASCLAEAWQLIGKLNWLYARWGRRHGLSYDELAALCTLEEHACCTQKQIAREWQLPKQSVNAACKRLAQKGFIAPAEGAARDGRERRLRFTEAGRALAEPLLAELHEVELAALRRLGPEGCAGLSDYLRKLEQGFADGLADAERKGGGAHE